MEATCFKCGSDRSKIVKNDNWCTWCMLDYILDYTVELARSEQQEKLAQESAERDERLSLKQYSIRDATD